MGKCEHEPMPEGYLARMEWLERLSKTHRQTKCQVCGLWMVWEPKEELTRGTKR